MNNLKQLSLLGLLMALHIVMSFFYIQISDNLRIYFTYLIVMMIAINFPLKIALTYALFEDLLAFFIFPTGPFFVGYTLTAVISMFIYNVILHKKLNIKRIILAKTLVNIIANILLNSMWSAILFSKGFYYYLSVSVIKNLVLLPIEIILFIIFYKLLAPVLKRSEFFAKNGQYL